MTDLSAFAITQKWPAAHPDRLQLYSLPTPNGVKVSIALEETGPAVRAAPGALRRQRPAVARVPVAEPEQQDPGHPRSGRPGRQAAGAVRVGRDPGLPGREDRPADARRRRRALRDHPVADVPDGRHRPDVRPARVLQQVRRQGLRGQAPARPLRRRIAPAAGACWTSTWPAATGSWATTIRSPTSRASRGSTTWWASTRPASWWASTTSCTSSACWRRSWRGRGACAGSGSRSGRPA